MWRAYRSETPEGAANEAYPVNSGLSRCSILSGRIGAVARAGTDGEGAFARGIKKSFPDEESCAAFLFKQRWPDGFVCPGRGKRRVVGLKSRPLLHECLDCGRRPRLRRGRRATHSNGMSARQLEDQLGVTYKTAWLLTQKLRRSMIDPNREPLEGVVEVDQAEIPFREGDAFFEPGNAGKILVIGAVEVIDRASNQARPRRKHAKYLDTRSGRLRLAMIADNSAGSIAAFVRANVKPGTTLLTDGHASYPGLSGYRHDPRIVGAMAGHVVLPWSHRAFSLLKRWALGTYHGLRRYRHVSFEALLGLATHQAPTGYWDIIKRNNPRKSAGRPHVPRLLHIDEPESAG